MGSYTTPTGIQLCGNTQCIIPPVIEPIDRLHANPICSCGYKLIYCPLRQNRVNTRTINANAFVFACIQDRTVCKRKAQRQEQPVPLCDGHREYMSIALTPNG